MPPVYDLTGQSFGQLTVLRLDPDKPPRHGKYYWLCQCSCGNVASVQAYQLRKGRTRSCGCLHHEPTHNFIDLTGHTFTRLTVLHRDFSSKNPTQGPAWFCQCVCGNVISVTTRSLRSERTRSCGCLLRERRIESHFKHGGAPKGKPTPEYRAWVKMKERCTLPESKDYPRWGGRGITVCPQWIDSFPTFLADMGPRPGPGYTLEREDNDGPYSPQNCAWVTRKTQARNTRNNVFLTWNNETHCISAWAEILQVPQQRLADRYRAGWSHERILTTPPRRWPGQQGKTSQLSLLL